MFSLTTGDVLSFLSSDFMPIAAVGEASRVAVEANAVDGSVDVAVVYVNFIIQSLKTCDQVINLICREIGFYAYARYIWL